MYKIFLNSENCKNIDKQCLKEDQEVRNGLVGWHVGKALSIKVKFQGRAEALTSCEEDGGEVC